MPKQVIEKNNFQMSLDRIDLDLLNMLQNDSKTTTKELAAGLKMSTTAVYERIKRMERNGIITGYVAMLNKEAVDRGLTVLCNIKLTQHKKELVLKFEKAIDQLHEVMECYHIAGEYDYTLKICVEDIDAYRNFLVTKLTSLGGMVGNTQSTFVINEVKHNTAFQL